MLGTYRVVCSNGLVIGQNFLRLKKKHIYELDTLNLEKEVSTALKRFERQGNQWREWADRRLTPGISEKVMKKMELGRGAIGEIDQKIFKEAAGYDNTGFPIMTLWAFFNVLTWYITHMAVSLNHRVSMETRLRKAIRGLK